MTRQTIYRLEGSIPSELGDAESARPCRMAGVGREGTVEGHFDASEEVNCWTYGPYRKVPQRPAAKPLRPVRMPPSTPHAF